NAAELEVVYQLLQIDGTVSVLFRMDIKVSILANGKVPLAPACHVVEFRGLANGAVRKSGDGGHEISVSTELFSGARKKSCRSHCVDPKIKLPLTRYRLPKAVRLATI